ncbi:MAG TPA: tetratricopeptide repeat protein [Chthoniobacterales bacterium]|jgi:Flp pilus assembly protein TadD
MIILLTSISYRNSLDVPFHFDDLPTIQDNPTIRRLWPITDALFPPPNSGLTTAGRPLVNLTLAMNYALGGFGVHGYHLFNLLAHIGAALTLLGVLRRTFLQPRLSSKYGDEALGLAAVVVILWAVHPLNTAAVTYIVQRAEVLMALFYLVALYGFIRGTSEQSRGPWLGISVVACLLSISCKEVGATIPLVIFLYDRTFVGGTFRNALNTRRAYYSALLFGWVLQVLLILSTGNRGGTAGLSGKMSLWDYVLTQAWAIGTYLKLSVWPSPLIFDYGAETVTSFGDIIAPGILVLLLLFLTGVALWKRPVIGFAAAAFFIILAPSSSVVPVLTQTVAEHRMYLPLAAFLSLAVTALYTRLGRISGVVFIMWITTNCVLTQLRNDVYATPLSLWRDTVEKRPENARAWKCLGVLVAQIGQYPLAIRMYDRSREIEPRDPSLYFNTANALGKMGRVTEAIFYYQGAIQMYPGYSEARNNLANILLQERRPAEAVAQLKVALELNPHSAEAHYNMGRSLQILGQAGEARVHLLESLRLRPAYSPTVEALNSLGDEPSAVD